VRHRRRGELGVVRRTIRRRVVVRAGVGVGSAIRPVGERLDGDRVPIRIVVVDHLGIHQ